MNKTLVLFDFDGTLTKHDTFNQFIFFSKGYPKGVLGYFLFLPHILGYLLGFSKGGTLKEKMTSYYFKGESEAGLKIKGIKFVERLAEGPRLNMELIKKLEGYKQQNSTVCIVSASLDIWIKPFADKYNINSLCTELEFERGVCTGNFKTLNCNNEEKVSRIRKEYDLSEYSKVIAYGNSKGDVAMFALASETFLIRN